MPSTGFGTMDTSTERTAGPASPAGADGPDGPTGPDGPAGSAGALAAEKPWDQKLAGLLVRPLRDTPVHPNLLTALSFLAGLGSAGLFAVGGPTAVGWAAAAFMAAVFLDHTDGELARLAGKTSELGHRLDYIVGSANYTVLFVGIGIGFGGPLAGLLTHLTPEAALVLGVAAGLSNPIIVTLRMGLERRHGADAVEHPYFAGFEIEDFIYLIGPFAWLGGLEYFLLLFGGGTIGYLVWSAWQRLRPRG